MPGTYEQHLQPFDRLAERHEAIEHEISDLLEQHGWKETCQTPGSLWLWEKKIGDGRTLLCDKSTALRIARDEAAEKVDTEELD